MTNSERRWPGLAAHLLRISIFVTIIWLIRQEHSWYQVQRAGRDAVAITLEQIQRFYPDAANLAQWDPHHGGRVVVDAAGNSLGYFVQTSPKSDHIVGYSGPTNTLIAFNADGQILGIEFLSSGDTVEHVRDVERNEQFMTALVGKSWEDASQAQNIDAVSGATLTSLAITQGISFRLGGRKPSLKFPDELSINDVKPFFDNVDRIAARPEQPLLFDVFAGNRNHLGSAFRTSPAADDVMGYQGPTDSIVALDTNEEVIGLAIRRSFDNEPYVTYVREDEYFKSLFKGKTLDELSNLDIVHEQIEGVSGATMTSMAIAYALPQAASAARQSRPSKQPAIVFVARDVGTCAVIAFALVVTFTNLRHNHRSWLFISVF